jgi:hypothetical protein
LQVEEIGVPRYKQVSGALVLLFSLVFIGCSARGWWMKSAIRQLQTREEIGLNLGRITHYPECGLL